MCTVISSCLVVATATTNVTTLAGKGTIGYADGNASSAQFYYPTGIAVLRNGSIVVADTFNHRIRLVTRNGTVTTLAGNGSGYADGNGAAARFNEPLGLAVLLSGSVVVADSGNHRIRVIAVNGTVSTLAGNGTANVQDGPLLNASFNTPYGVAVLANGDVVVADYNNSCIRLISNGSVIIFAGSGTIIGHEEGSLTDARFYHPTDIAVTPDGGLVVADSSNNCIRKIISGNVETLSGSVLSGYSDGPLTTAKFSFPQGIAVLPNGSLVVADSSNNRIRLIDRGWVTTLAGTGVGGYADGNRVTAQFHTPSRVAVLSDGSIVVVDTKNNRLRLISTSTTLSVTASPASGSATASPGSLSPLSVSPPVTKSASALATMKSVSNSLSDSWLPPRSQSESRSIETKQAPTGSFSASWTSQTVPSDSFLLTETPHRSDSKSALSKSSSVSQDAQRHSRSTASPTLVGSATAVVAPSKSASHSASLLCAADAVAVPVSPESSTTSEGAVRSSHTVVHVNLTRLLRSHPAWLLSADGWAPVVVQVVIPEQQRPNPFGFSSMMDLHAEANIQWRERMMTIMMPPFPSLALDVDEALSFTLQPFAIAVCPPTSGVLVAVLTVTADAELLAEATRVATEVVSSGVAATSVLGGAGGGAVAADVQALSAFGLHSCAQPRDRNMVGNIRLLAPAAFTDSPIGMLGGNVVLLCVLLVRRTLQRWLGGRGFTRRRCLQQAQSPNAGRRKAPLQMLPTLRRFFTPWATFCIPR